MLHPGGGSLLLGSRPLAGPLDRLTRHTLTFQWTWPKFIFHFRGLSLQTRHHSLRVFRPSHFQVICHQHSELLLASTQRFFFFFAPTYKTTPITRTRSSFRTFCFLTLFFLIFFYAKLLAKLLSRLSGTYYVVSSLLNIHANRRFCVLSFFYVKLARSRRSSDFQPDRSFKFRLWASS